jgi:transcriptional regulator with XRE-family HTH domain
MPGRESDARQALGEFIRMQRRLADLSLRGLAEIADVSNAYLSQVERGLYMPSGHVLKAIADALDLSAEALYAKAGLLDDRPKEGGPGVEEAIKLDDSLTPEQKEALIRVYQSLHGSA